MKKVCFLTVLLFLLCFASAAFAKINLNTASVQDLTSLPGIGKAKAEAIVKYREANGPFKSLEDLAKVKGIGPKMLAKLKDAITVDAASAVPTTPAVPTFPQTPGASRMPAAPAN